MSDIAIIVLIIWAISAEIRLWILNASAWNLIATVKTVMGTVDMVKVYIERGVVP